MIGVPYGNLGRGAAPMLDIMGQSAGIAQQGYGRQLQMTPEIIASALAQAAQRRQQAAIEQAQLEQRRQLADMELRRREAENVANAYLTLRQQAAAQQQSEAQRAAAEREGAANRASHERMNTQDNEYRQKVAELDRGRGRKQSMMEAALEQVGTTGQYPPEIQNLAKALGVPPEMVLREAAGFPAKTIGENREATAEETATVALIKDFDDRLKEAGADKKKAKLLADWFAGKAQALYQKLPEDSPFRNSLESLMVPLGVKIPQSASAAPPGGNAQERQTVHYPTPNMKFFGIPNPPPSLPPMQYRSQEAAIPPGLSLFPSTMNYPTTQPFPFPYRSPYDVER